MYKALQQIGCEFRRFTSWIAGAIVLACGAALFYCLKQDCAFSELAGEYATTCAGLAVAAMLFAVAFSTQKTLQKYLDEPYEKQRVKLVGVLATGSLLLAVIALAYCLFSVQYLCLHADKVTGAVRPRPMFQLWFYILISIPGICLALMAGGSYVYRYRAKGS